jgi:predicted ATPase
MLREITLRNILSFGPDTPPLELRALNVLIGPNGSGKSNLIEAISLLRSAAGEMEKFVSRSGGGEDWIWKGNPDGVAGIDAITNSNEAEAVQHSLRFSGTVGRLKSEVVKTASRLAYDSHGMQTDDQTAKVMQEASTSCRSILRYLRGPEHPEVTRLAQAYGGIRIYREWSFGRNNLLRNPRKPDDRSDMLEEDCSNLSLFLSHLGRNPAARRKLVDHLRDLYPELTDYQVVTGAGFVELHFHEGSFSIPASRLSDGSLRYLALLAILCDPTPPPLICIEEPELGLHPDLLHKIADLMLDASERTQLIVTTHSEVIVDALTDHPESIIVCEKHDQQTKLERLDGQKLKVWLEKYSLGQLWTRGQIGGTRW